MKWSSDKKKKTGRKDFFTLFFTPLCFSLFFSSCATTPPPVILPPTAAPSDTLAVYQTIPLGKSLLTSPRFKVVDDFNSGELKNHMGVPWQIEAAERRMLTLAIDKDDARYQYRGHSLKIGFNLVGGEQASVQSSLSRLDMSQAEYLAMKCRVKTESGYPLTGRFRVVLSDWQGKSVTHDITNQCLDHHTKYGDVVLPMSLFRNLDLDRLERFEFLLVSRTSRIKGNFWVDEIAFYSDNDVLFDSHRDNLAGFPRTVMQTKRLSQLKLLTGISRKAVMKEVARDTWKYFENARDKKTHLVVDHLRVGDAPLAADYTSPTNIAMDFLGTVAAMELGFIPREQAAGRIRQTFASLNRLKKWNGLFYNFYNTTGLEVTRNFVSSVDNGWLAISLVVIRQAFSKELGAEASAILDAFDFEEFLDPQNNQLSIGFDEDKNELVNYHYGLLATEARATSFYGIGKGDLPREHWWFIYRTPPAVWKWQSQTPQGRDVVREGVDYFQGYYTYHGKKFVPSWGGSLFEFLMPTLVLKERELSPKALGLNNRIATEIQRDYALKEKKYPVWGISPAAMSDGRRWRYAEFGVKALGAKGYPDQAVVTPHVSFLALDSLPRAALANIRKLMDFEDIYGEYGFYDSVNLRNRRVNHQYLALDQGMTLVAICNYLKKGVIQAYFHADSVGKKAADLFMKESFFNP